MIQWVPHVLLKWEYRSQPNDTNSKSLSLDEDTNWEMINFH